MPSQYVYRTNVAEEAQRHIKNVKLPEMMKGSSVFAEMKNAEDLITLWSYNTQDELLAYGVGNLWEVSPCEIKNLNVALFDLLKRHGVKNVYAKGLGPAMDQIYRLGPKKAPRGYDGGVKEEIYPPPDLDKVMPYLRQHMKKSLTN